MISLRKTGGSRSESQRPGSREVKTGATPRLQVRSRIFITAASPRSCAVDQNCSRADLSSGLVDRRRPSPRSTIENGNWHRVHVPPSPASARRPVANGTLRPRLCENAGLNPLTKESFRIPIRRYERHSVRSAISTWVEERFRRLKNLFTQPRPKSDLRFPQREGFLGAGHHG